MCDTSTRIGALVCRVTDLDHPSDETIRTSIAGEVERGLAGNDFTVPEKALLVDALLQMAQPDRLRALTADGRFNVLARLADVHGALWLEPDMLNSLENAHQIIAQIDAAHLAEPILGQQTAGFVSRWKTAAGYVPRDTVQVEVEFSGFNREEELLPLLRAINNIWGWSIVLERSNVTRAIDDLGRSWIEYYDPELEASASLLAGQLNGKVIVGEAGNAEDPLRAWSLKPVEVVNRVGQRSDALLRLFLSE